MSQRWRIGRTRAIGVAIALLFLAGSHQGSGQTSREKTQIATLGLRIDRTASDRIRAAESALTTGQTEAVLQWLEQIDSTQLIPTATGAISGRLAAESVHSQLPARLLAVRRAEREQAARRAWEHWRQDLQLEGLLIFCREHGDTAAGLLGWKSLAIRLQDQQQQTLALAAWQQVRQHPAATQADQELVARVLTLVSNRPASLEFEGADRQVATRQPAPSAVFRTRPAANWRWLQPVGLPAMLASTWRDWRDELRSQGQRVWPISRPLVLQDRWYLRGPQGLAAYELATGQPQWRVALEDWNGIERIPGGLDSLNFRQSFLELFGRQMAVDSILSRITHDQNQLFAIQDGRGSTERLHPTPAWPGGANRDSPIEPHNYLVAYDRQLGKLNWRLGGRNSGPAYAFGDQFFCGPPLVMDDLLYVIAQRKTELQLLVIRADRGSLEWSLPLGDAPRPLSADPARQRIACTPQQQDGIIYCPTAAGMVIAVDVLQRHIVWAARYGITPPAELPRSREESTNFLQDPWWDTWPEVWLDVRDDCLRLASPESAFVHQFQIRDGQRQWSVPRAGGRALHSLPAGDWLVQEHAALRRHAGATGELLWRCETGEQTGHAAVRPAGTLVSAGQNHSPNSPSTDSPDVAVALVPTERYGLVEVQLSDGSQQVDALRRRGDRSQEFGHLWALPQGWMSQNMESVAYWPDLMAEALLVADGTPRSDEAGPKSSLSPRQTPTSRTTDDETTDGKTTDNRAATATETLDSVRRLDAAREALAHRQPQLAREWLSTLTGEVRDELLYWCALEELRANPAKWRTLASPETTTSVAVAEHSSVAWQLAQAAAAQSVGDTTELAERLIAELHRTRRDGLIELETPPRKVRPDRALVGQIESWLELTSGHPASGHVAGGGHRDSEPSISPGPVDATRPWNATLSSSSPVNTSRPSIAADSATFLPRTEVPLTESPLTHKAGVSAVLRRAWSTAAAADPFALPHLAEILTPLELTDELLGSTDDSAFLGQSPLAVELRLLRGAMSPHPEVAVPLQTRLVAMLRKSGFGREAQDYDRWLTHRRGLTPSKPSEPATPVLTSSPVWTNSQPQIERRRERNESVYYFPVPFDAASSPFFDRLDLSIERQARRVRLSGGGHAGSWEVALPSSPSSFRYLQQVVAAWGRGRVIVLRVGFELFGLTPVDDRGEPSAHVLWHLDMLDGQAVSSERLRVEISPRVIGFHDEEYRVRNQFGHDIGQVGPVQSNYLCYREKGRLVCIDLWSGVRLWQRDDLPAEALLTGDGTTIACWEPSLSQTTLIRVADGATRALHEQRTAGQLLALDDGYGWWSETTPNSVEIHGRSLTKAAQSWQHTAPSGSIVCRLDDVHLGILLPTGPLQVLHARQGHIVATVPLPLRTAPVDRVVVSHDADCWYLAISERIPQQAVIQSSQLRNSYRVPFVTGTLFAIDRDHPAVCWQRDCQLEPFAWDQPKSAPVLLQVFKRVSGDNAAGQLAEGFVRLIDKHTGQTVFEHQHPEITGYAALTADAPQGLVTLALERETVRLWYRPRPPAPQLPNWD